MNPNSAYHWLRDSSDQKLRWLWCRSQSSNSGGCAEFSAYAGGAGKSTFDESDAGMLYWLIHDGYQNTVQDAELFGDQDATPAKLRTLFERSP